MEEMMKKLTNRNNPICFHMRKLGKSKKYRDEHKEFICDGFKLLNEAVSYGAKINTVLTSELLETQLPDGVKFCLTDYDIIESVSPLNNPQSLIFSCHYKETESCDFKKGTHIMLDTVQDPGNVGTIIRCANAFGIKSVILSGASADIYNPKTIRATMGAVFKQKIYYMNKNEIDDLKNSGVRFIGASNNASATNIKNADLNNAVIILGNEGKGISERLVKLCDSMISIPLSPECESINVAAAASIIMWESAKRP